MTQVERIRSFIAVDIGPEARAALGELTRLLARCGADARWVRPEGMHATLKFLGGVEARRLDDAHTAVAQAVSEYGVMDLRVVGVGAFPSLRRPRVLWAGLHCVGLAELAEAIDAALAEVGFESEKRPFSGHVTIARVRSQSGWRRLEDELMAHANDEFGRTEVTQVILYRSTLRPDGAVYSPLWTIPLTQHK